MLSTAARPLHICHVIYRLDFGGLENGLVNLVNRMSHDRYGHTILCLSGFGEFRRRIARQDVNVLSLDKREGNDPRTYLRVLGHLRRLRPDVVHTRNLGTMDLQWVALAAGVRHRVHGEHGFVAEDPRGIERRSLRIRRLCRPAIQRYVAMSGNIASWLERDVGVPRRRIRQIYNGVDTETFRPDGGVPADLPWSFGAHENLVVFGTVGRCDPIKNQAALVAAFGDLVEADQPRYAGLRLVIAGDGPEAAALRQLVRERSLERLVWFAGPRNDVPQLMRAMDVFVLPSRNEGISNTILEAMASARPVIAARVGGNEELVAHRVSGELYDPTAPEQLVPALARYAASERLRREHGVAGRTLACDRFSLRSMVTRYEQFYDELVGRPAA